MITIRQETEADAPAREALLDRAFGPARHAKPSERLRAGRACAGGLAFVAVEDGCLIGAVRLWNVAADADRPALLLGPLAVAAEARNRGIGGALMRHALGEARRRGHSAVILVGDAPYYARFGFSAAKTGDMRMPGPYEPRRLLACELEPGALDGAKGVLRATGRRLAAALVRVAKSRRRKAA